MSTPLEHQLAGLLKRPRVAIVGTRKVTAYGGQVTRQLASQLAAQGVVIVSGLAFGVDKLAHEAALEAGGTTVAVLPSPVHSVYPRSHAGLAQRIVASGGLVISEYPPGSPPFKGNFVARNRLVTAMSDALLITEAMSNSGTMHTARFAMDQGVEVMVVPGNITSPASEGTNNLLRQGAAPVIQANDILHALDMPVTSTGRQAKRVKVGNPFEQCIIDLMEQGISDGNELLNASRLDVQQFNHHLTMLEITAKVRPLGANHWGLA